MLQINTGKLFTRGVGHTNHLRGVLYSNVCLLDEDVETEAGILRVTGPNPHQRAIVYELEERIERPEQEPAVLLSHTVSPYLRDFCAVASFGLRGIFSENEDVVRRLTNTTGDFSSNSPPHKFVQRFFDRQLYVQPEDREGFSQFVADLLALERSSFRAAIRAIRTFVAGLHSVADDLGLAYTLFVSSAETLAQDCVDHQSSWQEVEQTKRLAVDEALIDATEDVAIAVRAAILRTEHTRLAEKYRGFIMSSVTPGDFRTATAFSGRTMTRRQLPQALQQAYRLRSKYIHQATPLPDPLCLPHSDSETTMVDRRAALTFQGLVRVTEQAIRKFVKEGPKVASEPYDYTLETHGVMLVSLAPQYWVGKPLGDPRDARSRMEGFLQQLAAIYSRENEVELTDLRPVLEDVKRLFPHAPKATKPALYALYVLFNRVVAENLRAVDWENFAKHHYRLVEEPSSEVLILRTILGHHSDWDGVTHQRAYDCYWEERLTRTGLHAPRLFEAAAALDLAERYRKAGDGAATTRFVSEAVENHPGHRGLLDFEAGINLETPIVWREILLPTATP